MEWICNQLPLDEFERQVLGVLVESSLPGQVANNFLIPHVTYRNLPNEHDLLVFRDGVVYTIDAKALQSGHYRSGGGEDWEYARRQGGEWERVTFMQHPLIIAFKKAQVLTDFFRQLRRQTLFPRVPEVVSVIVVPDTADVSLLTNPAGRRPNDARLYLTSLRELCARLAEDTGERSASPDYRTVVEALQGAPSTVRATGRRSDNLPCYLSNDLRLDEYLTTLAQPVPRDLYRGHHEHYKTVRVEIIPLADDAERLLRAWRMHFEVLYNLSHDNILRRISEHEQPWSYVVVEEFFSADSLARCLEDGPLDWPTTRAIFRQVTDALRYAHDRDIVHRFLGPESILIGKQGVDGPKIKLFGFFGAVSGDALTFGIGAASWGFNPYLAPEIVRQDASLCRHAMVDAFSVGRCLRAALTGDPEELPVGNVPPTLGDILLDLDSLSLDKRRRGWAKLGDFLR